MKKTSKSSQIALGGVFSGLCLLVMFMTGLIPFGTYAFPAIAGVMLAVVMVENGPKVAMMVYASVSLLSFLIVPDKEAAMIFVFFFGYYPVLKRYIQKIKWKSVQFVLKLLVFNAAMILAYYIMIVVIGIPDLLDELESAGQYFKFGLLAAGNVVFFLYDFALDKYIYIYKVKFRKKLLR